MFAATSLLFAGLVGSANAIALESRDSLLDPSLLIPGRSTCNILLPLDPLTPFSCTNRTVQNNLCCFNAPGGQLLQTQFWNYDAPVDFAGPKNSWTIHGLWPDHCDGTFDEFCDSAREVNNITQILQAHGENEILDYMHTFWKDDAGDDESFWDHEFNKHATCISTLQPQCIQDFKSGDDVVIFVKRVISLFQTLPTFQFLEAKGIVPSTTKMYKLSDINEALTAATGKKPTVGCNGPNETFLDEMWYDFHIRGSVIDGLYVHADPDSDDTCAEEVWYWPKGVPTPQPTPTSSSSAHGPTSTTSK